MPDLNPLKFAVAIQDEATGQLNKIEQEFQKLKDKTITVKVEGLSDLQNLLSALQHQQVQNIGKDVASGIHDAAKGLQEEAQKAVRASLGQLAADLTAVKTAIQHDNFTAFSTRIEKCAEAVNTLDAAFKQFHVTIGQDAGMKNFMTGLGEVIRNVRTSMGQLNGFGQTKTPPESVYVRNVQKMEDALYRIQEARAKVGNAIRQAESLGMPGVNNMRIYLQMLDAYEKKLQNIRSNPLMMHENGWQAQAFGTTFKHLLGNAGDFQRQVDGFVQKQNTLETNQRRFNTALEESEKLLKRLDGASTKGFALGIDTSKTDKALQDIQQFIDKLLMFDSKNLGNGHAVNELIAEYTRLKSTLSGVAREQEKLNSSTEKANKKAADNSTRKAQKDNEAWTESMRRAGVEATKLEITIRKLQEAEARGKLANVDTTNLSARIAELQNFANILRSIESGSRLHGHTSDFVNSVPFQNAIRLANEEAAAVKKSATDKEHAARAAQQLTADEQRLAQALNQTTQAARGQSQVLSDLKSLATQYLGVWGGQQFLHNIIETGGQLEMQRLSIGAILQNQAQANDLFNKIKGLATQSPFGVVQLDQMTKQLTAYGFKYNELFDMTKRLADISAATGTGVDRLALALGHVRSEAALSGYTLRQFSMGNIPLLQKLSEKLGKTTKEIRDMVRKKEISYEDVVGILKDLTDEGGMFYNMQEVISESVKAKFKNVKDAMDIMYGEMAEGSIGDALKEVASVLMDVTKNWKEAATVLLTVTGSWYACRAVMLLYNQTLGQNNAATLASIARHRQKEAALLREASSYRTLTSAEKSQIATSKLLTMNERIRMALHIPLTNSQKLRIQYARQQHVMDQALALSSKKLTTEDIARQVATGKLTKAEAVQIITLADLTNAERIAGLEAVNNTKKYGMLRMALLSTWGATKKLGAALLSFALNPAVLITAGVTALTDLWMRNKQEMERASELADTIRERANSAMLATRNVIDSSKMVFNDAEGKSVSPSQLDFQSIATIRARMTLEFDKDEAQSLIDEWTDYIRQYSATPNKIINDALFDGDNLRSVEEQFHRIGAAMGEIVKAQYGLHDVSDIFENATKATDSGWFNDDIITNINEYEQAVKDYNYAFAKLYKDHGRGVDKIVKAVEKSDAAFANAVSGMNTYGEKFKYLIENMKDFSGAYNTARSEIQYSDNDLYNFLYDSQYGNFEEKSEKNWSKSNMDEDLETFFTHIEAELNNKGQKIGELTQAQQQDLLLGFTDFLGKTKVTTKETTDYLKEKFAERFQLNLDVDDEKFQVKVDEVTEILNGLVEGDWKVDLTFVEHIDDAIEEARKKYKLAKEFFEKTEQIRLKFGIDLKMGQLMDDATKQSILSKIENEDVRAQVAKVIDGLNQASTAFNKATEASNNLGFSLEDPNKKKGNKKGNGSGSGHKAYKDEFAKRWDERIRIMKEAYDWYDKWEKKVGNDAAIAETNSKYADIFNEWRTDKLLPMDFDVNEIADYTKYVEKIRDDALKRYQAQKNDKGKNNGQEALRVYRQAVALLNDVKFDGFTRAAEEFKSIIDQTITDLNERWDMFNTVRSATGNVALASRVAGIDRADGGARNTAAAMMNNLKKSIIDIGGDDMLQKVVFSTSMDDERIRNMFEGIVPDGAKEKIDGLIKSFKEWQKLQKQLEKEDIQVFASLIGSAVDLQSEVVKINDEYNKAIESLDRLKNSGQIDQSQHTRGVQIATANRNTKLVEATAAYKLLVDGVVTMRKEAAQKIRSDYVEALKAQLKAGAITAKDYANKIQDINKKMRDLEKPQGDAQAYMKGGLNGLFENMIKRGESMQEEGAQIYQDAQDAYNTAQTAEQMGKAMQDSQAGEAMMQMGEGMSEFGGEAMQTVAIIDMIVHGINDLVQGLKGTFDEIREMYDALGHDTKTDSWEDWNTFWSSFSAASDSATKGWDSLKNGNVGGVIEGVVGSFTGWITGFAKGHDQKRQNHIEKIQKNIDALNANTNAIKLFRDRTLGYDFGQLRRYVASTYTGNDAASKGMRDFYSTNLGGNGYVQEYSNLQQLRQGYIDMYNEEDDKKKSSEEALLEYKQKIAELDEQIRYFSEDLAKELWDIDIKGWADQLSDALASAFENGESMAKAYKETVTSILQQVMNKMMQMAILEPMFQSLQDKLFGNAEKNITGVFNPADPQGSMAKVTAMITDFFGKGGEGEKTITAATEFMAAYQRGLQNAGLSVLNDSANTLSSSVQGTSEETSDLLAGYVNALRQDVAVNRILFTQFVTQLWPEYVTAFANHVKTVANIDVNVQVMMEMMRDGRGAMYDEIHSLRSRIDNVVDGIEGFKMR